jgi:uncharacterized small protein (DUF1192 family)
MPKEVLTELENSIIDRINELNDDIDILSGEISLARNKKVKVGLNKLIKILENSIDRLYAELNRE